MNSQSCAINIRPGWGIPPTVKVSQYDVGRPLAFVLMDGQEALTIASGTTVKIEGTKPSGLGFSQACELDGNTATINTVATMTQEAGAIPCELVVSVGSTTIGTANFNMMVELSAHPDGTTDGDAETAKDLMTRAEEAVAQAEAAAESISQAGIDTTGATAGQVPTAKGDGTWTWEDQQGGGTSTVDAELSTTSENPVQNKAIAAAVGSLSDQIANKGTYSKPSGGIPKSDLASAVQTSLDKAETALQTAPVSSVNGQTGAVVISAATTSANGLMSSTDKGRLDTLYADYSSAITALGV